MHPLPLGLSRFVGLVAFAEAIYLVTWYSGAARRAAAAADTSDRSLRRAAGLVVAVFTLWLASSIVLADGSTFPIANEVQRGPLSGLLILAFFLPILLWSYLSQTARRLLAATEPSSLIAVQWYRSGGVLFLFPFLSLGILPAEFAIPAGIGDTVTGLLAPVVAWAVATRRPGARQWAIAWNLFGILDLIVAPVTALHSHAPVLQMYPLSMVPLFVGPPVGILTHLLCLRSLALHPERGINGPSVPVALSGVGSHP